MPKSDTNISLKIVPSLMAGRSAGGEIVLPKKFVEGLVEFQRFWSGKIEVYMALGPANSGNLDDCELLPGQLPCSIVILPHAEFAEAVTSDPAAIVLLSLDDFKQSHLAAACRERGVACAYVCEYSLQTRKQIVDATTSNPLRRMRRKSWESQQEKRREVAVRSAAGVQCNGTPTFDSYRNISSDSLLYFDTRVTAGMLASDDEVNGKPSVDQSSQPLRLAFSGRLTRMKGVQNLIPMATALRKAGVNFHLAICGDGDLKDDLSQSIQKHNLSEVVSLRGVLDFATELVPFVKESVDLFVCCHPQGDPSCTYLETMSCGVPIVGFANEALDGVVRSSGSGWLVPMNRTDSLASEIERISKQPAEVLDMSLKALAFAREHTFEQTFSRRADHLRSLAY